MPVVFHFIIINQRRWGEGGGGAVRGALLRSHGTAKAAHRPSLGAVVQSTPGSLETVTHTRTHTKVTMKGGTKNERTEEHA